MVPYRFIAVEGPIGVGKTTLATLLSERIKGKLVLEEVDENPFLPLFYQDRKRYAFVTQIFFLLSRYNSLLEVNQRDIFSKTVVSDYFFEKDWIFAHINLDERELILYRKIYEILSSHIPSPDLVIYLQAGVDTLIKRIKKRGRPYEMEMDPEYLKALIGAYNEYLYHYTKSPILMVNAENLDVVGNPELLDRIIEEIKKPFTGKRYLSLEL